MSQNPLGSIRRREPRRRGIFPDEQYRSMVLDPLAARASNRLDDAVIDVLTAHAISLAEQRIVPPDTAASILAALVRLPEGSESLPQHPLAGLIDRVVQASSPDLMQGTATEEIALTAMRIVLRERLIEASDVLLALRETIAELAGGNVTTLLLATANGQTVQPTTLGHYLAGQLGALARTTDRLQSAWERLNLSPLGAVSGMSTAMPIRRGRTSELLGFDGVIDSTFDAVAATDVFTELASIVAVAAIELIRLVNDLSYWARDDVGVLVPGDEFVHATGDQPQRRDPLVLDHLRAAFGEQAAASGPLATILVGRQMLGGTASHFAAFEGVDRQLASAIDSWQLLTAVLKSAVVNRAQSAHRAHRGFPTSSELADLLAVDFQLPRADAHRVVEQVVIQGAASGIEATTLRPELIDQVALREMGKEIGIEQELLAKCLAPKRFVERRDVTGGPAPQAVSATLDRDAFAQRRANSWLRERRHALDQAATTLAGRRDAIIERPSSALERAEPAATTEPLVRE